MRRPVETELVAALKAFLNIAAHCEIRSGARCTWWDSIGKVGLTSPGPSGHRLPCCPHCGGMLFEMENEGQWFAGVDRHEVNGHPGYRAMIEWSRGKCFRNFAALEAAYAERSK